MLVNDEQHKGVGPHISGELWVRGPQIMKGYHENEKATNETLTPDGWLRTGDIGHYDDNNEFYITDRLKELIKVKGFQVPPAELEEILRDHPDIADAAVSAFHAFSSVIGLKNGIIFNFRSSGFLTKIRESFRGHMLSRRTQVSPKKILKTTSPRK